MSAKRKKATNRQVKSPNRNPHQMSFRTSYSTTKDKNLDSAWRGIGLIYAAAMTFVFLSELGVL